MLKSLIKDIPDKGLLSKIYRQNLTIRKQTTQLKMGQRL
jgi:hypothetical protein